MLLHIHNEHTSTLFFSLQPNQPGQSTNSQCSPQTSCISRKKTAPTDGPASWTNNHPKFPGAEKLISVRIASSSRRNFTKNVAVLAFTEDERMSSNVKGVLGKKQLSPNRIQKIRQTVFNYYPLEGFEDHEKAWANCRRAIDEAGRTLNQNMKK